MCAGMQQEGGFTDFLKGGIRSALKAPFNPVKSVKDGWENTERFMVGTPPVQQTQYAKSNGRAGNRGVSFESARRPR